MIPKASYMRRSHLGEVVIKEESMDRSLESRQ